VLQHAKYLGLSRSDHRAAYYYYYTRVEVCIIIIIIIITILYDCAPRGETSFARYYAIRSELFRRNLPHTRARPPGDFNALVTCRDDDAAAAPRAIIAAVSRACLYYYYYHHRWIGDFAYVSGAF